MGDYNIKELQKCILNILLAVDKVCREHNIRYWLSDGTMLGAVRHGGFIPWDDDADIAMPRPDYQRFIEHGEEWLPAPFELQTFQKDENCTSAFLKVIDGSTTLIERWALNSIGGVYIDVCPIDGIPAQRWRRKLRIGMVHAAKSWVYLRSRDPYKRGHGYTSWLPLLLQATTKNITLQRLQLRLQTAYDYETAPLIADYDSGDRSTMPREVMGTPTPIMFEGHELLGVEHFIYLSGVTSFHLFHILLFHFPSVLGLKQFHEVMVRLLGFQLFNLLIDSLIVCGSLHVTDDTQCDGIAVFG